MTRVAAHDQGFVAAPAEAVYGLLVDPRGYAGWWPGIRAEPDTGMLRGLGGSRPVPMREEAHRPGVGLVLRLGDPRPGTLEWLLQPFDDGTVVNAILHLDLPMGSRRAERRLRRIRSSVHGGLVGLKRSLEGGS